MLCITPSIPRHVSLILGAISLKLMGGLTQIDLMALTGTMANRDIAERGCSLFSGRSHLDAKPKSLFSTTVSCQGV